MVTANVSFVDGDETLTHHRFEDGASLPRTGDTVHLGHADGSYKVIDVVHDYGAYDEGDTIVGGEEVFIHVTNV